MQLFITVCVFVYMCVCMCVCALASVLMHVFLAWSHSLVVGVLQAFMPRLLHRCGVECFVTGNYSLAETHRLGQLVEKILKVRCCPHLCCAVLCCVALGCAVLS